ncbi:MAG: hypothetical protein ACF8R7_11770, partial [Phycisphaerales bacterium JB039]
VATQSYAADYADRIFAFSWQPGVQYPFGAARSPRSASDPMAAGALQAIDILHRRADREDMTVPSQWIPHVLYTHLIIQDYLASRLPEPMVVCPEDRQRRNWQQRPRELFDQGFWLPAQPIPSEANKRWPYSSSYEAVPASYDRSNMLHQGASPGTYFAPAGTVFGETRLTSAQFPGGKVHFQDSQQRHLGAERFYAYADARVPLLFFDASVRIELTADSNPGWQPNDPQSPEPTRFRYDGDILEGHYRWTRGGLAGVDFGAGEIDTGQR